MWFSDFRLVLPDRVIERGAVRVEDGFIAEIRDAVVENAAVRGGGRTLLPAFVDLHGDMIEREIAPRPNAPLPTVFGVFELDKKMAAAGVTTAFASLSFSNESVYGHVRSLSMTRAIIDTVHELREQLRIDHKIHARYEVTNIEVAPTLETLLDQGRIALVSLMDHTPGQGQYRDLDSYVASLAERKALSREAAAEIAAHKIAQRGASPEVDATLARLAAHVRRRGLTLASHDDDSPEKVAAGHALGVGISEFPVTLAAATEARKRGLQTLMGAPNALRGRSMSGNLGASEAMRAGLLSMLAADYHPASLLLGALRLIDGEIARLPEAAALLSRHPARAVGLTDRGEIAIGQRADFVAVELGEIPHLRATFRGGRMVYGDGTLYVAPDAGVSARTEPAA